MSIEDSPQEITRMLTDAIASLTKVRGAVFELEGAAPAKKEAVKTQLHNEYDAFSLLAFDLTTAIVDYLYSKDNDA